MSPARGCGPVPSTPPRLKRLFEHAEDQDAILLVNGPPDATFFWATGLHSGGTFEGSAAVLRPGQAPLVVTSTLEETTARKSDNEVAIYEDRDEFWSTLDEALDPEETVGVNLDRLSVTRYREIQDELDVDELADATDALETARLVKDPDEVDRIEDACRITDGLAERMDELVARADTEAELAAEIAHEVRRAGATLSFEPVVAAGAASAEPHYHPGPSPLEEGPLLVDMGAKLAGYCSDITRTYSIGEPDEQFARMHEVVLEAQQAALDAIEPGVEASEVHEVAMDAVDATEFEGRFIHSTGHSLGVEVHDGPGLSSKSEVTLGEGMVFTVEPGVYVPGDAGVRIEEDVVVTPDGCRRLTGADRSLTVL